MHVHRDRSYPKGFFQNGPPAPIVTHPWSVGDEVQEAVTGRRGRIGTVLETPDGIYVVVDWGLHTSRVAWWDLEVPA